MPGACQLNPLKPFFVNLDGFHQLFSHAETEFLKLFCKFLSVD